VRTVSGRPEAAIDQLDARLIRLLRGSPRIGVLEASRRLGVARGTVQARLDRLLRDGVVEGFGPDLGLPALGYDVLAFVTVEITQGYGQAVLDHLRRIPEVLEAHTITGPGDLHCRVVAHSNGHLQQVIDRMLEVDGIRHTTSVIALSTPIAYRVLPLVEAAAGGPAEGSGQPL
jgi:DNA-binding Lrp family transcriptional regulator